MTFRLVDEMLTRQMTGAARSPAAERLGLRLVQFARGVAVYEMPVRWEICDRLGTVPSGVLTTLGEAAMTAAAATTVADGHEGSPDLPTRDLCARFERAVTVDDSEALRAEAVVMRTDAECVRVEADVLCDGVRVATFESTYLRDGRIPFRHGPVPRGMPVEARSVA